MTEMICFYRTSFISHVDVILIMMLICITVGGYIFAASCAFLRKENGVGDNTDRMFHSEDSVGSRGKGREVVSVSCFEDFLYFCMHCLALISAYTACQCMWFLARSKRGCRFLLFFVITV